MGEAKTRMMVYGAPWCPDRRRAKKFLHEQRVPFEWIDLEDNPPAQRYVESVNAGKQIIPTIVFPDGSLLVEPSNAALARKLGLQTRAQCPFYDLIVVGGGPTGLTAALYAAREGLETLVIERGSLGGQASTTERIDNYPAFPEGISGAAFAERMVRQAERFAVEILHAQEVESISRDGSTLLVTAGGARYGAGAVLLAMGSTYRRLGVPGEEEFIGAGVHFCATCDGPFYRGKDVVVIGGGNSAVEEGAFLTGLASTVTILARGPQLTASKVALDTLPRYANLTVHTNVEVVRFEIVCTLTVKLWLAPL